MEVETEVERRDHQKPIDGEVEIESENASLKIDCHLSNTRKVDRTSKLQPAPNDG